MPEPSPGGFGANPELEAPATFPGQRLRWAWRGRPLHAKGRHGLRHGWEDYPASRNAGMPHSPGSRVFCLREPCACPGEAHPLIPKPDFPARQPATPDSSLPAHGPPPPGTAEPQLGPHSPRDRRASARQHSPWDRRASARQHSAGRRHGETQQEGRCRAEARRTQAVGMLHCMDAPQKALYPSCAVSGRVELSLRAQARLDLPGSVQD